MSNKIDINKLNKMNTVGIDEREYELFLEVIDMIQTVALRFEREVYSALDVVSAVRQMRDRIDQVYDDMAKS